MHIHETPIKISIMKEKHLNLRYFRPKPLLWHIAIVPVIPFDTFANNMELNKNILFTYPLIFIKTSTNQEKGWKICHLSGWGGI